MKYVLSLTLLLFIPCLAHSQSAIEVTRSGSGDPVLFLPGFVTPGEVWEETIRHLDGETENHLVTYAGFGGLEAIDTPWYPSLVESLVHYIEQEELSGLTVIGHSMGGTLAVDLAAVLPGRIDKLVLVDALPCMREVMMPGVPAASITYDNPYNNNTLNMTDEAFAGMAGQMAAGMASAPEDIEAIKSWIMQADRKTYVYGFTDLLKLDLRDKLKDISAKTLVLGAPAFGTEVVAENLQKQYATLEHKEIAMAPAGRHFIMLDEPLWFYQKVNTFLAE